MNDAPMTYVAAGVPRHPLVEPMLFYDPPYENPLDDRLAWHLVRALAPGCALQYRTVLFTPDDCFRANFLIEQRVPNDGVCRTALLIGEGAEDAPLHDALVVGVGAADVLYRFRRRDLDRHLPDALLLMAKWNPVLFGADWCARLAERASPGARRCRVWPGQAEVRLSYASEPVDVEPGRVPERPALPSELVVRRLSRRHPATWQQDFRHARAHFSDGPAPPVDEWHRRRARSA